MRSRWSKLCSVSMALLALITHGCTKRPDIYQPKLSDLRVDYQNWNCRDLADAVRLAVEGAETLARGDVMPLPPNAAMPWARAVLRDGDALVPLLDLEALAERLAATGRAT